MRTINPAEITGKIISLIDEAEKELIFISPYNNFEYWDQLFVRLKKAIARGVKITFFVKKDVEHHKGIYALNAAIFFVDKLHANIYLSERQAILSSMNLVDSPGMVAFDFGIETEYVSEVEEVKKTYFPSIEKAGDEKEKVTMETVEKSTFHNVHTQQERYSSNARLAIFKTHFQNNFPLHKVTINAESNTVNCSHFPFSWTNLEFAGTTKVNFLLGSNFDYKKFRDDNIVAFNEVFRNHKTYWSYPFDHICIYGDETANGINKNDLNAQMAYLSFLIKEVMNFLQPMENNLFRTSLYCKNNYNRRKHSSESQI